ncbi:methionine/alanine import family NSS transporter small subunit [Heyndrickxia sporothermodurans]
MGVSAITMMIVGVVVIWGGLVVSVVHAIKKSKQSV